MVKYSKKNFYIYSSYSNHGKFVIHNIHKEFNNGHTHVNNYKHAKYILNLAYNLQLPPTNADDRLIVSLIRISDNTNYIEKLNNMRKNNQCK